MKLVDRETFLSMPEGTIYSYSHNLAGIEGLYIKKTDVYYGNDWIFQDLVNEIKVDEGVFVDEWVKATEGKEIRIDYDCAARDGAYETDDMFAIWDKTDIMSLVTQLLNNLP